MNKQIRIAVRVPEETKTKFNKICQKKCLNGSLLIRKFIDDFIKKEDEAIKQ